jgi:hypothetical protein
MQADWEFEVGGDAPVIEFPWPGFVDLAAEPQRICELTEVSDLPALADALVALNSSRSAVRTSKCDVWVPALGEVDADELDASAESAVHAIGCYIDLLPRDSQQWATPEQVETDCRRWCGILDEVPLSSSGVTFVVRATAGKSNSWSLGITAYLAACGATPTEAKAVLEKELAAFAHVLCADSKLQ